MKIVAWLAAVSLTVPGCTGTAAGPPRRETIRYDTSACFGFCPDYTVTVSSDGRGVDRAADRRVDRPARHDPLRRSGQTPRSP